MKGLPVGERQPCKCVPAKGSGRNGGWLAPILKSFKLRGCSSPPKKIWRRGSENVPSIARVAAGAFGFLTLIQVLDRPLYQRLSGGSEAQINRLLTLSV